MNFWIIYWRERFPILSFSALACGISLSGIFLHDHEFILRHFLFSFIGLLLFFAIFRLIEDLKNIDKDSIANKEPSLSRDLIKKNKADKIAIAGLAILLIYSCLIVAFLQPLAGVIYGIAIISIWIDDRLQRIQWMIHQPILKGFFHQFYIIPLVIFSIEAANTNQILALRDWSLAIMLFGSLLCYEICQKLSPYYHPVYATFVHLYGFQKTFEVILITLAISAMGAVALNLTFFLIPCELVVLLTLALLFFQIRWFYLPAISSSISLMIHAWAIVIIHFFKFAFS